MTSLGWALIQLTGVFKYTQREDHVKIPGEDSHRQTSQGEKLEHILPSQPLEGSSPADTLIWDFRPPELGGNKFLLLKHQSVTLSYGLSKLTDSLNSLFPPVELLTQTLWPWVAGGVVIRITNYTHKVTVTSAFFGVRYSMF